MARRKRRGPEGLLDRVAAACRERDLLSAPPVAVAVSGGVDSMVLMHLLTELGAAPTVVTLDHGIRPESADEVRFVADAARALGLEVVTGALGVEPGPDLAARARRARYDFLDALPGAPTIALAQHRDDQAETVLDRLIRGAGGGGLSGMGWRRGRYIRPLLGEPRAAILAWAEHRGVPWVEDPSNRAGTRGVIRHQVLPLLSGLRPGAPAAIARAARLLAEDEALLRALTEPLLASDGVDRARFALAPAPLRRRAVLALVAATRGRRDGVAAAQLDAAMRLDGGALDLPGGWRLVADADRLRCLPPIPGPALMRAGEWGLWRLESPVPVAVRSPRPGERLGRVALTERLRAAGVPVSLRGYHPVVELEGAVWVPGVWCGKKAGNRRVVMIRSASASWPGGGPYAQAL